MMGRMPRSLAVLFAVPLLYAADPAPREWPVYGGGPESIRHSTLKQINRANVKQLTMAWSYDAQDGPGGLQTSPIIVGGVLYANTPKSRAIALDAATGKLLWKFDSGLDLRGANRGVTYWAGGDDRRIFAAAGSYVYALDARTGKAIAGFGSDGRIDLREDLGREPSQQSVVLTTPGVIYKDLLIVGGRTSEGLPASPGDVRAYDVRTGKLRWSFHTIPHPGEFGYETWPKDAWTYIGSANNWPGMAVDEKRGIVYAPTGSAAADFYGANRVGDNLFANTLLALDANTGKRLWHFQAVKHDLWDRDFPSPPNLVTVRQNGRQVDAVAQTTKHGYVFLFDRTNGKPLFPIESRKYPASTVPGEVAAETQALPTRPAPFARQTLTENMLTNRTPEAHQWALEQFRKFISEGQFVPPSVGKETIIFPGFDGGAEWGGSAFDPGERTALRQFHRDGLDVEPGGNRDRNVGPAAVSHAVRCLPSRRSRRSAAADPVAGGPGEPAQGGRGQRGDPAGRGAHAGRSRICRDRRWMRLVQFVMSGEDKEMESKVASPIDMKYRFTGYHKFVDPEGYPAIAPPWGTLNAINLNTGEYAWKIPLGEYPELAEKGMKDTGSENYGGPIVTAGGLVFIGATSFDKKLRAFDKDTGKLLWETTLPFAGNATPATYEVGGRQFVVIAAGGGKSRAPSGGMYVAFALPGK